MSFQDVQLREGRGPIVNQAQFIRAVAGNMKQLRLFTTVSNRAGAQSGGGNLGICIPQNFKTLHSNFDICRNFQRIKMKFLVFYSFRKGLFEFFFVRLVNYLLTRFILSQAIWSKFRKWLLFNQKYAGIVKTWEIISHVCIS